MPIQARKARRTRALTSPETLLLTLGALGTLGQTCGVKIGNTVLNGKQMAVVVIEDARFSKDEKGNTTLAHVIEGTSQEIKEKQENNDADTKQTQRDLVLPRPLDQTNVPGKTS